MPQNKLKTRSFHLFEHPKWSKITFAKTCFLPIFDPFVVPKRPIFRHFGIFHGPKRVTTGSTRVKNSCLSIQNGLGTTLGKSIFSTPWTHVGPRPVWARAALHLLQVTTSMGV